MPEVPFLAQCRCRGICLVIAIALSWAVSGCQTPTASAPAPLPAVVPVPPAVVEGEAGVRRAMADVPAAVRVVLFSWFAERFADTPACADGVQLALAERRRAAQELLLAARQTWIERSGGLLVTAGASGIAISRAAVAEQHAMPDFAARTEAVLKLLQQGVQAAPPLAECLADELWPETARLTRDEFALWYRRGGGKKVLSPPPGAGEAQSGLTSLAAAAGVRETILERLLQAEELERRRKFADALQGVEAVAADEAATKALGLLGDTEITARIQEKRRFLPQTTVSAECEYLRRYHRLPLAALLDKLMHGDVGKLDDVRRRTGVLERRLSQRLTQWQADARFGPALERYANEIEDLIHATLAARLGVWETELRALPPQFRSWEQYEKLAPWLAELRSHAGSGGVAYRFLDARASLDVPLAHTALQAAEERLLPIYAAGLTDAFADWRAIADREVTLNLRHGIALAVAERILDMVAVFPAATMPVSVQDDVRWARERIASSLERFLVSEAACGIQIDPLESATAGLGATWARDLEARLRDVLARTGYQTFAHVVPVDGEADSSPRTLRILRGRIADFSADETTEKTSIREVRELSEPRLIENIEGKTRYEQKISRRAIHVRAVERVAHVRIQFQIQSATATEDVEINRFFRKEFLQESSHPFLDVAVLETRQAEKRSGLSPASPPLELRSDRVWTPSEMLDWVRQTALDEMAERVCARLAIYPLQLVARAREATERRDWLAATDAWGYADAYLARLRFAEEPGGDELPEDVANRQSELTRWRGQARQQLFAALLRMLQEHAGKEGTRP